MPVSPDTFRATSRVFDMSASQSSLGSPAFPQVLYEYGNRASGETHGLVLTKPHIVALILDLAGYVADKDLGGMALLDPSCGQGAFVVQAVERLMSSSKKFNRDVSQLHRAISSFDIDAGHVNLTREAVIRVLQTHGVGKADACTLAEKWIVCADFLLAPQPRKFDFVVGNPPYIRIEQLSSVLQEEYRQRYRSIYDRADLYVAFIEQGLNLLTSDGVLSFICADRWILNKYGAPLRKLLSERFNIRCYIDLHRASPFDTEVIAYPSIFAISPGATTRVHVGALETASPEECATILPMIVNGVIGTQCGASVSIYNSWFYGDEPWVISTPEHLVALRSLEKKFEPISINAKVGIGVATGSDKVYIVDEGADIERDRLVPLVMREDIERGRIRNAGRFVINTFEETGGAVELAQYPKLARYLESNETNIRMRHVAKKNPRGWFRTIDRVYPRIVSIPKLLIPDIAGSNEVVFDVGYYHPHHNLYFITSDTWDMEVLGGLLSSKVALFFVWSYAVKMRGGYLRFQAQYLRRIRLPDPENIPKALADSIQDAFRRREFAKLDALAYEAYGIEGLPDFDFVDTRE